MERRGAEKVSKNIRKFDLSLHFNNATAASCSNSPTPFGFFGLYTASAPANTLHLAMRLCLKSLLLAVVMLATEAYSCPAANASDDQISREIPHLRQLFQRYSGGHNALTLEDLQKLFQRLEFTLSLKENEGHSHHQGSSSQPPTNEKPSENDTHRHRQVGLHSYTLESPGDAQSLTNNNSNKNHPTYSSSMRQPVDYGSKHQTHDDDDEHDHHGKHRVHHEDDELLSNSTIKQYGVESTSREPVTKEIPGKTECSEGLDGILVGTSFSVGDSISVRGFLSICPGILNFLDVCTIDSHRHEHAADGEEGHGHTSGNDHSHGHDHSINLKSSSSADSWIGAVSSMVVIGLVGLACVMVIPVLKQSQYYDQVNHFLVALAVGTLAGDALIHLLPHAISMKVPDNRNVHIQHAFLGFTALGGIILFLFLERSHNMFCGHGHSHGHGHEPDLYASRSKEEIDDKETVETATTIEDAGSQSVDKIGEKLSRHSKHNSFIYAESTMSLDAQNCFEGCSSNVSPSSDANGNSDIDRTRLEDQMSSAPEKQVLVSALENEAEIASIEKQVAKLVDEKKLGTCATEKEKLVTSPVEKPELVRIKECNNLESTESKL
ncbi:hypothetical protein SK128_027493 [Halocaridina rubra]|uniref:Uncharacterized protein n=1 Tax=Halocaridina rubra TaxID=373956 RepID=A0AAN8XDZ1_HALRR